MAERKRPLVPSTAPPAKVSAVSLIESTLLRRLCGHGAPSADQALAVVSLARGLVRAGASTADATQTPHGLYVSITPKADASHGEEVPLSAALVARVCSAFSAAELSARVSERPVFAPVIATHDAVSEALWCLRDWFARVRSLESECVRDQDVEGVHELRIAIRRARTALRWLESLVDSSELQEIHTHLRQLASLSGAVRDMDVLSTLLSKKSLAIAGSVDGLTRLRRARRPRMLALRKHLKSVPYLRACAGIERQLEAMVAQHALEPLGAKRSAKRAAGALFDRELRRVRKRLEGDLTVDEGYHAVRRQLRRVRDAIDLTGSALDKPRARWRARLHPVQSLLGAFNDAAVACTFFEQEADALPKLCRALAKRRVGLKSELATPLAVLAAMLMTASD
ncbi:MAG: CHAD domain-containing protein [Deltaproteobacteria bacterium]|nr:CHAD domain-containing protein [Deltaproteobacteria bacterium]